MTMDTQTLLAQVDDLTNKAQRLADELAKTLTEGGLPPTRELYEAHELLHHGAAHLRGAGSQVYRHQLNSVTTITRSLLADEEGKT